MNAKFYLYFSKSRLDLTLNMFGSEVLKKGCIVAKNILETRHLMFHASLESEWKIHTTVFLPEPGGNSREEVQLGSRSRRAIMIISICITFLWVCIHSQKYVRDGHYSVIHSCNLFSAISTPLNWTFYYSFSRCSSSTHSSFEEVSKASENIMHMFCLVCKPVLLFSESIYFMQPWLAHSWMERVRFR